MRTTVRAAAALCLALAAALVGEPARAADCARARGAFARIFARATERLPGARRYVAENGDLVHLDAAGFPRCIERASLDGAPGAALALRWNAGGSPYRREVTSFPLAKSSDCGSGIARWVARLATEPTGGARALPESERELAALGFDARSVRAIAQIQRGGNEYRAEHTAAEWLAAHPIADYTLALNRELSRRFGMGFSADVYRQHLWAQPDVRGFAEAVRARIRELRPAGADPAAARAALRARLGNARMLVAKGYLEGVEFEQAANPRSRAAFLSELRELTPAGLETLATRTGDPVRANIPIVATQIARELDDGRDLLLLCASKGCLETLGGLAQLERSGYFAREHARGRGRVLAVLNMSGVGEEGSFFADWAAKGPQYPLVAGLVRAQASKNKMPVRDIRAGLRSIGRDEARALHGEILPHLPADVTYLNFIGITDEFGLARHGNFRRTQTQLLGSRVFPAHGANDALVEYPGIGTSPDRLPGSLRLPVNSGHTLLDGQFMDVRLWEPDQRSLLMEAILSLVADRNGL